jgi:capsular polysaccharide transport system permease protein
MAGLRMSAAAAPQGPTLAESLAIQSRVVGALLMREIVTRYGRHNLGFMWLFLEPMLFTLGITALWVATKAVHGSSLPIVAFAVTGYSSVLMWRNCAGRCAGAIGPNATLMFHRNVRVIDLFASRILLEIAGATMSLLGLSLVFCFIGWMDAPVDLLTMLEGWLLLGWFGIAMGLLVGGIAAQSELVDRLWHTVTYVLFPLSGAGTMVDWLPPAAQNVVLWLPMVHGVEMLRHGYYGSAVRTFEDPAYLITCNVAMTLVGLVLVKAIRRGGESE